MNEARLNELWEARLLPWLTEKEAERKAAVKGFLLWAGGGVSGALLLFFALGLLNDDLGGLVLVPIVIGGLCFWAGLSGLNRLRRTVKQELLDRIAGAFEMRYALRPSSPARFDAFRELGLLPGYDRRDFEDHFAGERHGVDFELYEAHLEEKRRSKNRTYYVTKFRGVLIRLSFPRKVEGVTVITRDQGWFNGLVALGRSFGSRKLERIGLVDPKFEKIFEVYGDDQVLARYMLTPSFMERLLALETALSGKNVRAAFDEGLGRGELLIAAETGNKFEAGSMFRPLTDRSRFETILTEIELVTEILDLVAEPASWGESA